MTLVPWVRHHPLLGYFALTFGISWGGILVVLATTGFDLTVVRPSDTGLIFVCMLLGPSIAGLTMTSLLDGRARLRNIRSRLLRWRVASGWYALDLLTMPLLMLAVLLPFSLFADPAFAPGFHWQLFAIGLVAGTFEEIGWTGFATPRLLERWRALSAGLMLGLVWALWHVLVDFRQNQSAMGLAWLLDFAVLYLATLTAYRILMTWMFDHTESLLLAVLMHASYTGWLFVLFPATSFEQGLAWQSTLAAALWLVVVVVGVVARPGRTGATGGLRLG
ncbi:MAG: CPBP family intramembrane glutamic endopeptidase [Casimicrobium sp.]